MNWLKRKTETFAKDREGSIAIVFSLILVVLVCLLGLAIDFARAQRASAVVMRSIDAAALYGSKVLVEDGASDGEVKTRVANFLDSQIRTNTMQGSSYSGLHMITDPVEGSVSIDVEVHVPTTFSRIFNADSISFHKSAKTSYKIKNVELAMVLDTTGSMGSNNKIDELKVAAAQAIDILMPPNRPAFNKIALAPYSASVNAGALAGAVSNGASVDQCVVERQGATTATDDLPVAADALLIADTVLNPNYSCPVQEIMPLSKDANLLKTTINAYGVGGGTAGHIGLAWGWYLISPNWNGFWPAVSAAKPYGDPKTIKAIIMMTDGAFNTSYYNGPINTTSAPQGLALCDAIKAAGITIYSIGFELASNPPPDDVNAPILLSACASPDGGGGTEFYNATNGSDLSAAFVKIAGKLSKLRLSN